MKKLLTLALLLAVPISNAAALETVSHKKSSSAFSKERDSELHKLRGKVITAHREKSITMSQRDLALALHDLWSYNRVQLETINGLQPVSAELHGDIESFGTVLISLASVDQSIFDTLKKFETTIDSKKEEEKKS